MIELSVDVIFNNLKCDSEDSNQFIINHVRLIDKMDY